MSDFIKQVADRHFGMSQFIDKEQFNNIIKQNTFKPKKKAEHGQYSGKCRCGNNVFCCNKYCDECGAKLDWN